jgi:hypothetical protein
MMVWGIYFMVREEYSFFADVCVGPPPDFFSCL